VADAAEQGVDVGVEDSGLQHGEILGAFRWDGASNGEERATARAFPAEVAEVSQRSRRILWDGYAKVFVGWPGFRLR
jgi:hypothetical protein